MQHRFIQQLPLLALTFPLDLKVKGHLASLSIVLLQVCFVVSHPEDTKKSCKEIHKRKFNYNIAIQKSMN